MSETPFPSPLEETVVIVGVGLIGGSLAAAIKQRGVARWVIGVGRNSDRIQAACTVGLIDEAVTDVIATLPRASLIVFCTPVDLVAAEVRKVHTVLASIPRNSGQHDEHAKVLLTDAASVKSSICTEVADVPNFIGSHPIAGSHRQGFEAADARLFEGRLCVLTPTPKSLEEDIQRIERFWQSVGMRTVRMLPAAHDEALAMTSHLPHIVAASLSATLSDAHRSLTGSGFRDTTRIAAGDPDLWAGILINNSAHLLGGIDKMQERLTAYRDALSQGNPAAIRQLLQDGQQCRSAFEDLSSPSRDEIRALP